MYHSLFRQYEDSQTAEGVKRIKDWVKSTGFLTAGDAFISADVDEVLSRETLQRLRHCEIVRPVLSGAIVMPLGNLDRAMKTEFPVFNRPHSFAQPSIYDWGGIEQGLFDGSRLIMSLRNSEHGGPIEYYVVGGIHMTANSFVATTFLKDLTATEYTGMIKLEMLKDISENELVLVQEDTYNLGYSPAWKNRMDPIEQVQDMKKYIPWFLNCNKDRYPYWFGKPDPRNKDLSRSLHNYFNT